MQNCLNGSKHTKLNKQNIMELLYCESKKYQQNDHTQQWKKERRNAETAHEEKSFNHFHAFGPKCIAVNKSSFIEYKST